MTKQDCLSTERRPRANSIRRHAMSADRKFIVRTRLLAWLQAGRVVPLTSEMDLPSLHLQRDTSVTKKGVAG